MYDVDELAGRADIGRVKVRCERVSNALLLGRPGVRALERDREGPIDGPRDAYPETIRPGAREDIRRVSIDRSGQLAGVVRASPGDRRGVAGRLVALVVRRRFGPLP